MKAPNRTRRERFNWLAVAFAIALSAIFFTDAFAQQSATTQTGKAAQTLITTGQRAFDQGRYEDAIRAYTGAIAMSSNSPATAALAQAKLGNVYLSQGKFEAAVAAFQKAISLDPANAESYNHLGEALGGLREYNRALEAFSKAIALEPKLLAARYNTGITYERLGNFKYAEFVFRILIRDHPDYDLAYDGLAVALSKSGRAREAIPFHEKAITLKPQEPSYYYDLALSYLILGNTEMALELKKKLQVIDPQMADRLANVIVKRHM